MITQWRNNQQKARVLFLEVTQLYFFNQQSRRVERCFCPTTRTESKHDNNDTPTLSACVCACLPCRRTTTIATTLKTPQLASETVTGEGSYSRRQLRHTQPCTTTIRRRHPVILLTMDMNEWREKRLHANSTHCCTLVRNGVDQNTE